MIDHVCLLFCYLNWLQQSQLLKRQILKSFKYKKARLLAILSCYVNCCIVPTALYNITLFKITLHNIF